MIRSFYLYEVGGNGSSYWKPFQGLDSADAFVRAERAGFKVQYGPSCSVVLSSEASWAHYRANT